MYFLFFSNLIVRTCIVQKMVHGHEHRSLFESSCEYVFWLLAVSFQIGFVFFEIGLPQNGFSKKLIKAMRISLFWSSCEHFVLRNVSFQIGFSFLEVDCATMDFPKLLQGHEDNSVLDQAVNMLVVFNPFSFKFDFPLFFEIRLWPTWICQNWFKAMSIGLFWVKL